MKPEDIKVGETYNVRVKADRIEVDGAYFQLIDENGHGNKGYRFYNSCYYAFSPTPTPPKYDPCRPFKAGDIVRAKKEGIYSCFEDDEPLDTSTYYNVVDVEKGWVNIFCEPHDSRWVWDDMLELVTPVEELEPYKVDHNQYGWHVEKDGEIIATYNDERHPHTKEAAEAECERLNEEYRKEQK